MRPGKLELHPRRDHNGHELLIGEIIQVAFHILIRREQLRVRRHVIHDARGKEPAELPPTEEVEVVPKWQTIRPPHRQVGRDRRELDRVFAVGQIAERERRSRAPVSSQMTRDVVDRIGKPIRKPRSFPTRHRAPGTQSEIGRGQIASQCTENAECQRHNDPDHAREHAEQRPRCAVP